MGFCVWIKLRVAAIGSVSLRSFTARKSHVGVASEVLPVNEAWKPVITVVDYSVIRRACN